jgi:hypothetical protein
MMSQMEKCIVGLFASIIVIMFLGAGIAADQRNNCRLELAKAGRSAEDIIKICP